MARRDATSHHELESTSNKGALRRAKVGRVLRVPPDGRERGDSSAMTQLREAGWREDRNEVQSLSEESSMETGGME